MKNLSISFLLVMIISLPAYATEAGSRARIEIEVIKGESIEKSSEIITFDKQRFRIDLPGTEKTITEQTPYIMTVDGGESWVIGDKPKDKFYCSKMQTEEFFKNLGDQVTDAIEFFNVTAETPSVKQIIEEPGPDILGFKTTHIQIETNAKAYAWFLFMKFEYRVKIIDDLWYTTDVKTHPVRKKWINALTQSGNSTIDSLFADYTAKLAGPVLKSESITEIYDVRKKETKTQKTNTAITEIKELKAEELDDIFKMPECKTMDDDEVQDKAKALFSADKIML